MSFVQRIAHLRPEGAYVVLARAQELEAQGRDIIHLEIGQPDFDTYANVSLAGIRAIATGKTGYNPSAGITPLRDALAQDAGRRRGVTFSTGNVVVGPGAKPFLFMPLLALLEAGDEVVYPDPGFPTYEAAIAVAGGVPAPIPLDADRGFDLDLDAFDSRLSSRTKLVILNSPGNPTGGIYSMETLEHVAEAAQERDIWVLSDEVYSRLVYGEQAPSITALPGMLDRTILVDGFSKTYAMTGWRLGYGIMPEPLAQKVSLLLNHSVGCTATFVQYAGLEAVLGPQEQVDHVRAEFQRRRDVIVEGLNAIPGIHCHLPRGAFYVFPNVEAYGRPARKLASYLLDRAGVALLPGTDFGQNGEGHLRLSYASSIENIREALDRMRHALEALT
jgi:aspartate/methionine/tyrosine aminotransferase